MSLFILLVGIALYWVYFDGAGIVKTNLFKGFVQMRWEEIGQVVEKPGLEHGILKLEIVSKKSRRIDIYSNWVKDYELLFDLVDRRITVDTSRTRLRETAAASGGAGEQLGSDSPTLADSSDRSTRTNLRLRVTAGQILYLLAMMIVTFFLFWQAFNR